MSSYNAPVRWRRRLAAPAVLLAALTLSVPAFASAQANTAAVAPAPAKPASSSSTPQAHPTASEYATSHGCPLYQIFGIRGSGEQEFDAYGYGSTVDAIRTAIMSKRPGGRSNYVNYPAIAVRWWDPAYYLADYWASEVDGQTALQSEVEAFNKVCGKTPVVIIGFSQGAHAAGNAFALLKKGIRARATLILVGDTRFNPDPSQALANVGTYDPFFKGVWASVAFAATLQKPDRSVRTFADADIANVHSYCAQFDPVCGFNPINSAHCASPDLFYCPHTNYVNLGYAEHAAAWAASRLPLPPPPTTSPIIITGNLPAATKGVPYQVTFEAISGTVPYTWKASGTALRDGLTFDARTATLTGTPTATGQFSLTVTVTDKNKKTSSGSYPLTVRDPAPPPLGPGDWSQANYDAGRSDYNADEHTLSTGNVATLTRRWGVGTGLGGLSAVYQGVAYGSVNLDTPTGFQNKITAYDLGTGAVRWSRMLGPVGNFNYTETVVAVGNDELVLVGNGSLHTLNMSDGSDKWRTTGNGTFSVNHVAMDGNKIVAYTSHGYLALDASNGLLLWSISPVGTGGFAVGGGVMIRATRVNTDPVNNGWTETLEATDEADGHTLWSVVGPCDGTGSATSLTVRGGTAFWDDPCTGAIDAHDLRSGAPLWSVGYNAAGTGTGLFGGLATDGQTVYGVTFTDTNGVIARTLRAYRGGAEVWHADLVNGPQASNVAFANGVVYVATGAAQAFDAATGKLLWTGPALRQGNVQTMIAEGYLLLDQDVFGV